MVVIIFYFKFINDNNNNKNNNLYFTLQMGLALEPNSLGSCIRT